MTYREAADILANNDPLAAFMNTFLLKKKKEAEKLAIEVLTKEAEKMERAKTVPYKEI